MDANANYPLKPFRIEDRRLIHAVIRQWPLATLMSGTAGNANISLLPLLLRNGQDDAIQLLGHLDANNEHAGAMLAGAPISFQFRGPDRYASPDLYDVPHLPGWLYISVTGHGIVDSILEERELRSLLCESTVAFGSTQQTFTLDPADKRIDMFIGAIRGFSIRVDSISGIAKLAQDKGPRHAKIAANYLRRHSNEGSENLFERLLDN